MVCLGNICCSPLAKVILRNKTKHLKIEIDSAGTANFYENKPADPRGITLAKKLGLSYVLIEHVAFVNMILKNLITFL